MPQLQTTVGAIQDLFEVLYITHAPYLSYCSHQYPGGEHDYEEILIWEAVRLRGNSGVNSAVLISGSGKLFVTFRSRLEVSFTTICIWEMLMMHYCRSYCFSTPWGPWPPRQRWWWVGLERDNLIGGQWQVSMAGVPLAARLSVSGFGLVFPRGSVPWLGGFGWSERFREQWKHVYCVDQVSELAKITAKSRT